MLRNSTRTRRRSGLGPKDAAGRGAPSKRLPRVALVAVCVMAWGIASAFCDEIIMIDGSKVQGNIIEETPEHVRIRTTRGAVVGLPRARIKSIKKEKISILEAEGDLALSRKNYYKAKELYLRAQKEKSGSQLLASKLEKVEKLIEQRENALFEGLFQEGLRASAAGNHQVAAEKLGTIITRAPDGGPFSKKARRVMACEYILESKRLRDRIEYARAVQAMENAAEVDPSLAIAHLELASVALKYGKDRLRAVEEYKKGLELARAYFAQDEAQRNAFKAFEPAETRLDKAKYNNYRCDLAELEFDMGKKLMAARVFLELLEEKDFPQGRKERIVGLVIDAYTDEKISRRLDPQDLLEKLDKALELNPRTAKAWVLKGQVFLKEEKANEAIEAFTKALELDAKIPTVHSSRAEAYMRVKETEFARVDLMRELAIQDSYEVRCALGRVLLKGSEYDEALEQFTGALEVEPEQIPALQGLAKTYRLKALVSGVPDTVKVQLRFLAEENIKKILKKKNDDIEACLEGARLLKDRKQFEEAADVLGQKVIEKLEERRSGLNREESVLLAESYVERGEVNISLNNKNKAEEDFKEALKVRPDFSLAYNKLGEVALLKNDFALARSHYEKAIEQDPKEADFELSLAILCHQHLKNYLDAIKHYKLYQDKGGVELRVASWIQECKYALETDKKNTP